MALFGLRHGLSDLHRDPPRRVLVHLEVTGELKRGEPLLRVQHEDDCQEPLLQGQVGVVEDGPDGDAKRGLAGVAAVPVLQSGRSDGCAVGTPRRAVPARTLQVGDAGVLCGELIEEL